VKTPGARGKGQSTKEVVNNQSHNQASLLVM
jgi:hypothetical protein